MLEILKHSLGLCGEHWHPNIFTLLMGGFGSLPVLSYIKHKIKRNKQVMKVLAVLLIYGFIAILIAVLLKYTLEKKIKNKYK